MSPSAAARQINESAAIGEGTFNTMLVAVTAPLSGQVAIGPLGFAAAPTLPSGVTAAGATLGQQTLTLPAGFSGAFALSGIGGHPGAFVNLSAPADAGRVWVASHSNQP